MMNFRYHLVSLVAVFLALAIGVILGAGPLQTRLSTSLSSALSKDGTAAVDVNALAEANSRAELDADTLAELTARLTPGSLEGRSIVTVSLPGANADDVQSVRQALQSAGATLAGAVTLTDNWDSMSMDQYRQNLAPSLESHLTATMPTDATPDAVIGYAIVEILTTTSADHDVVAQILSDESTPILTIEEDPQGAATTVVAIGARDTADQIPGSAAEDGVTLRSTAAWAGLARAIGSAPSGGLLLGDATADSSMVSQVRTLAVPVTTVDQVGTGTGLLSTVLALPGAVEQVRSFGAGVGAQRLLPDLPAAQQGN